MLYALTCVAPRHDPWLVLLALCIGACGCVATMTLFARVAAAVGQLRFAWAFLAAAVAGSTTWCMHFIALLGFMPGLAAHIDPVLTLASFIAATAGLYPCIVIAASRHRGAAMIGGALAGLAIGAMHYTGMLAYRIHATITWRPGGVALSLGLAIALAMAAFTAAREAPGRPRRRAAAPLLLAAVAGLHFSGMAAMRIAVLHAPPAPFAGEALALALALAVVSLMVVAGGILACAIELGVRRETGRQLRALRRTDPLTGLANDHAFAEDMAESLASCGPQDERLLVVVRSGSFEEIVECHGAAIAETVLRKFADRLRTACPPGALIARTGDAEFSLFGQVPPNEDIRVMLDLAHGTMTRPFVIELREIAFEPRLGVARWPADASSPEDLHRRAHLALSRALDNPLDPVALHDELSEAATRRRHVLASDLHGAIGRGEFELVYQPQVMIEIGAIIGHEALLRWHHPEFGLVSPAEFIPLAEASGAIVAIGDWTLRTACQTATAWPEEWSVAVNLSPLQLCQPDLPDRIRSALEASELAPQRLEIELTETLLVSDRHSAHRAMDRIRALGVRLALDDFGTGYSSFEVLRRFPFDKVKLDKCFVADIEFSPRARAIVHAMLALGRALAIPVLIEGVETERQLAILRAEGCRKVQGFLTGRPVTAENVGKDRFAPFAVREAAQQVA